MSLARRGLKNFKAGRRMKISILAVWKFVFRSCRCHLAEDPVALAVRGAEDSPAPAGAHRSMNVLRIAKSKNIKMNARSLFLRGAAEVLEASAVKEDFKADRAEVAADSADPAVVPTPQNVRRIAKIISKNAKILVLQEAAIPADLNHQLQSRPAVARHLL